MPTRLDPAFLGGIYSEYVGRDILNSGVGAVSQLCLEFCCPYYINPDAIQCCIADHHYNRTAELYQKYFCITREHQCSTHALPNMRNQKSSMHNLERFIMLCKYLLRTAGKTLKPLTLDSFKKTSENNAKFYVEYELDKFYREIVGLNTTLA